MSGTPEETELTSKLNVSSITNAAPKARWHLKDKALLTAVRTLLYIAEL